MSFTLKDIKGAVVEKKQVRYVTQKLQATNLTSEIGIIEENITYDIREEGFNQAIDAQSSVKLRFNREKLAEVVRSYFGIIELTSENFTDEYAKLASEVVNYSMTYGLADAIISGDKDIIEVEEGTVK